MRIVFVLTVAVLLANSVLGEGEGQRQTLTRLTYSKWINLLRYAHNALKRDPVVNHTDHLNRTEQVELIASAIVKHFYNDILNAVFTDDGFKMAVDRFPVDFLIMLDSSARIGSENFANAKRVITMWVDLLDARDFVDDQLRVSMVSFSEPDKVIHEFSFGSGLNKTEVIHRINGTQYHAGQSSSTAQALWVADAIFGKYSRSEVTRVMLMVTDGWSNTDLQLPFGVLWPSARLRRLHHVQVYVAGVGDQINHNELKAIASRPVEDHLVEVTDYQMMLEVLERVQQMTPGPDSQNDA